METLLSPAPTEDVLLALLELLVLGAGVLETREALDDRDVCDVREVREEDLGLVRLTLLA